MRRKVLSMKNQAFASSSRCSMPANIFYVESIMIFLFHVLSYFTVSGTKLHLQAKKASLNKWFNHLYIYFALQ